MVIKESSMGTIHYVQGEGKGNGNGHGYGAGPSAAVVDAQHSVPGGVHGESGLLNSATTYFNRAAECLNLDPGLRAVLEKPEREMLVSVPVVRDDGRVEVFTGCRVQHSTVRGPGKGGGALSSARYPGGSDRPCLLDDLEVRRCEYSLRWRERGHNLRPHNYV